jgi:hypothetical protein
MNFTKVRTANVRYIGENFAYAQAMVEKRRSNAAGKHLDKRTRRARTRSAAKARAMKEWS